MKLLGQILRWNHWLARRCTTWNINLPEGKGRTGTAPNSDCSIGSYWIWALMRTSQKYCLSDTSRVYAISVSSDLRYFLTIVITVVLHFLLLQLPPGTQLQDSLSSDSCGASLDAAWKGSQTQIETDFIFCDFLRRLSLFFENNFLFIRPCNTCQYIFTAGVCNRNAIVATCSNTKNHRMFLLCPHCVLHVSWRRSQEQFENVKKGPGRSWNRFLCFFCAKNSLRTSPKSSEWILVSSFFFLFFFLRSLPSFSSFVFFLCFLLHPADHPAKSAIFINLHLLCQKTITHEESVAAAFAISICGGDGRYLEHQ